MKNIFIALGGIVGGILLENKFGLVEKIKAEIEKKKIEIISKLNTPTNTPEGGEKIIY